MNLKGILGEVHFNIEFWYYYDRFVFKLTLDLPGWGGWITRLFLRDCLWGPDGVNFDPKKNM